MSRNRFFASAAAAALLILVLVLVLRSGDAGSSLGGLAMVLVVGVGFVAVSKWPAGRTFVLRRPRWVAAGGVAFAIAGFCAFLTASLMAPDISDSAMNAAVAGACGCLFVGMFIAFLPATLKRLQDSRRDLAALRRDPPRDPGFHPLREAVAAWRSVATGWPVLLRIAGPWLAIEVAALGLVGTWANHLGDDPGSAVLLLLCLAVLVMGGLYVVLPTVAVWWFRWVISGEKPTSFLVLPTRGVFGLAWRLWLFLSVLGTLDSMVEKQVQAAVAGSAGRTAADIASWGVLVGAVALASSFALRFPALAMRDESFTRTLALVQGRRMSPGLPMAVLLCLAPFVIVGWAAQFLVEAITGPIPHPSTVSAPLIMEAAIGLLLVTSLIAAGCSLLSQAYLRAKSTL